jgi:hypothetical protein
MLRVRFRHIWRRHKQRLFSLALVIWLIISHLPLPLATPRSDGKDLSKPFPCQNRPCGCRSAEQCWKSCCCFSNAQKIAWAKANSVRVPEFVKHAISGDESRAVVARRSCCAKRQGCCVAATRSAKTCCDRGLSSSLTPSADTHAGDVDSPSTVIGVIAQECQGGRWSWVTGFAVCSAPQFEYLHSIEVAGDVPDWLSSEFEPERRRPPIPPPRLPI